MTTPVVVVKPSKLKAWVGFAGALLGGSIVPAIIEYLPTLQAYLPPPWPSVIGALVAVATWFSVHQTKYKPAGTVLVRPEGTTPISLPAPPPQTGGVPYPDPWGTP